MNNQIYYRKSGGKYYRIDTANLQYEILNPQRNWIERGVFNSLRQARLKIDYMEPSSKEEHWRMTLRIARQQKRARQSQ